MDPLLTLKLVRLAKLLAAFTFVGMQAIYTNFTITYLFEDLGFSLAEAGRVLGLATLAGAQALIAATVGIVAARNRVLAQSGTRG